MAYLVGTFSYCGSASGYCANAMSYYVSAMSCCDSSKPYCANANAYCDSATRYCADVKLYCGSVKSYCVNKTCYCGSATGHCVDANAQRRFAKSFDRLRMTKGRSNRTRKRNSPGPAERRASVKACGQHALAHMIINMSAYCLL